MKKKNWLVAILFILAVEVVGFLSGRLSGDIKEKYNALMLPPLSPPDWLFGVVWVVLYALIGYSAYRIYVSENTKRNNALGCFYAQIAFNFLWSIVFFGLGKFWIAFIIIIILDLLVITTMFKFNKIDSIATCLMIPYIIWLLFATYLCLGVAVLN